MIASLYYTCICVHIKKLEQWYIPYFSWNIEAFNQFHLCTYLPSPLWYFKIIQINAVGQPKPIIFHKLPLSGTKCREMPYVKTPQFYRDMKSY